MKETLEDSKSAAAALGAALGLLLPPQAVSIGTAIEAVVMARRKCRLFTKYSLLSSKSDEMITKPCYREVAANGHITE
jgi:hypothetical protein